MGGSVKLSRKMKNIAEELDKTIAEAEGENLAFALIVFNSCKEERANYISNASREEVIKALEVLLSHWRGDMPGVRAHEVH